MAAGAVDPRSDAGSREGQRLPAGRPAGSCSWSRALFSTEAVGAVRNGRAPGAGAAAVQLLARQCLCQLRGAQRGGEVEHQPGVLRRGRERVAEEVMGGATRRDPQEQPRCSEAGNRRHRPLASARENIRVHLPAERYRPVEPGVLQGPSQVRGCGVLEVGLAVRPDEGQEVLDLHEEAVGVGRVEEDLRGAGGQVGHEVAGGLVVPG